MTTVRRDLALTVVECALGALLALLALSRTWRVVTGGGPVRLPSAGQAAPRRRVRTPAWPISRPPSAHSSDQSTLPRPATAT